VFAGIEFLALLVLVITPQMVCMMCIIAKASYFLDDVIAQPMLCMMCIIAKASYFLGAVIAQPMLCMSPDKVCFSHVLSLRH
jgi:hypothetical protein